MENLIPFGHLFNLTGLTGVISLLLLEYATNFLTFDIESDEDFFCSI